MARGDAVPRDKSVLLPSFLDNQSQEWQWRHTHSVYTNTHVRVLRQGLAFCRANSALCHFHRYWFKSSVSINNGTFYCSFLRHDLHSLPKQIVISSPIIGFHKREKKSLKDHQQKSCMANVTDWVDEERQVSALSEQRGGQEGRVWGWRWEWEERIVPWLNQPGRST